MRRKGRRGWQIWAAVLLIACAAPFVIGCDDDDVEGGGLMPGDAGEPDDIGDDANGQIQGGPDANSDEEDTQEQGLGCTPGEVMACVGDELSAIEVCDGDGFATEPAECPGTAVCRDAECVQVRCTPGSGRCDAGEQPQTCVSDGDGDYEYVDEAPCGEGETCEAGACLDRCGIAELTHDYVGCEYWAVETDNQLLHTDTDGNPVVDPEHRPPFAVVLANTETDVTARVKVEGAGGELAESIPAREVRSHRTNPGDEYVTVYSETVSSDGDRIGGPHQGPIEDIELPPGATLTLLLPNRDIPFGETTVTSTAYRVQSSQPVVAYQFNPFCCNYNYTNDASLLLPSSALTENYMMMSHAVWAGGANYRLEEPRSPTLSVVAMEPDTTVEVQLRASEHEGQSFEDQLYPVREGDGISGPDDTGRMVVTLEPHEVFNVAGGGADPVIDLTGARVVADKPVAAFGAHTCTNIPFTQPACDHIESQLFPLETWATDFVLAPHKIRNPEVDPNSREGTYWKFVAREDETTIRADISVARGDVLPPSGEGVSHCADFAEEPESGVFELREGENCEFGTRNIFTVEATRPISIAGFMSGQNTVFDQVDWGDHAGDPSMFLVPPQDQYRISYTFLTPPTYHVSYITVIIPPNFDITLDGETVDPMEYDYEMLEDQTMLMSHIEVEPGPHQIEASIPFGLIVYGFDNYVSYSYTGGLDLTKLNPL